MIVIRWISRLQSKRIELIAPHRKTIVKPKTQDGRPLRRYKRRWRVERLFAWLYNFGRIVTRYEYKLANFLGFLRLAGFMILAKKYL
ncbi:transposase [Kistimonas scapharcae]|uniref:transposase n=1 Tax=Kistimonas scapharcae TaxID=1036133 RepID=UPI003CD0BC35